jgi:ABC-type transport system involved in cytochrome bd biosynthesis fused ATPase/permease subunit
MGRKLTARTGRKRPTPATRSEQLPIRNVWLRHFAITRLQLATSLTQKTLKLTLDKEITMRLKTVKLTNFRGYRTTTTIPIDFAMTGIVGRNDYGKSTVLEALAIFFDSADIKPDNSESPRVS